MHISIRVFVALTIFFSSSNSVFAGMSLSQAIIHFEDGGERSQDVEVFNQGQETLYVRVEPTIVNNPGTKQESREKYRDPRKAGLLVSPQRLVIAPGARKRIRFVRLDKPAPNIKEQNKAIATEKDRVFRVLVKPEVGELESTQTAVKIVVA